MVFLFCVHNKVIINKNILFFKVGINKRQLSNDNLTLNARIVLSKLQRCQLKT